MSLQEDLLELAERLVRADDPEPGEADLKRAVSTAYYALFHLLVDDASLMMIPDEAIESTRGLVRRAFAHKDMRTASASFRSGILPKHVREIWPSPIPAGRKDVPIPERLKDVADAFVVLQEERHRADYNVGHKLTKTNARTLVNRATTAFKNWAEVRSEPVAKIYLASILLWNQWNRDSN